MEQLTWIVDVAARESMLLAATGIMIGGIDDAVVDLLFLWFASRRGAGCEPALVLQSVESSDPMVVFVPAWDEAAVIGAMLTAALERFNYSRYRIYVGVYPNDPRTIAAVADVAARDSRVWMVVGTEPGPTTKAGCLNTLWHALLDDERRQDFRARAIVLHDAEDVVHPRELEAFDTLLDDHDVVQLPVLPLIRRGSLVSGHYADEFAYAHRVHQPVRNRLRAAMPLAGTGCAIARTMMARLADERGGAPFDAGSLTEDYEMGLRIAALGGNAYFARLRDPDDSSLIAVRAYFPDTLRAASRQKARWIAGIVLAGWDRMGWARSSALCDNWMRMRDRRAVLSVPIVAVAYGAALLWILAGLLHLTMQIAPRGERLAPWMTIATAILLMWRLTVRVTCTASCYGWREGGRALPRFLMANLVALCAAPRAMVRYLLLLNGRHVAWDKTSHVFPSWAATGPA
ncbi:glycosyl transferase family protein [Sphingomonas sp. MA1305]|uniref:glycosyl transferase family protein n=1 Tax=Sphingomonas sp. MA1305 TaxID=2479204 RepID=UPI002FCD5F0F